MATSSVPSGMAAACHAMPALSLVGMAKDTGLPDSDAQFDFTRARRARALARLTARLRREPSDVNVILPFEEVVAALGRRGEKFIGQQVIPLDSIVGTVDRGREFDRSFRPTSGRTRTRWERMNAAQRRGQSMPPIDVYRIGELHFVKDGHHRVSVARAMGHKDINAYVTEVLTEVGAEREITLADLPLKSHERLFRERVPLPEPAAIASSYRTSGATAPWPRPSRRGASARAGHARAAQPRRGRPRPGSATSTSPWWTMLREAGLVRPRHRHRGLHARVPPALPAAAHPRLGRDRDRARSARSSSAPAGTTTRWSRPCGKELR